MSCFAMYVLHIHIVAMYYTDNPLKSAVKDQNTLGFEFNTFFVC
jgi:hypothetical protein